MNVNNLITCEQIAKVALCYVVFIINLISKMFLKYSIDINF